MRNIAALAVVFFGILQLWPQEQIPKSKIVSDLSAVSHVEPPEGTKFPYFRVTLHLEQLLRGTTQQTDLQAESRWKPPRSQFDDRPFSFSGNRGTVFDYSEPQVGNRLLVGFPFLDVDRGVAHIFGAIDLGDHDQAQLVPEVQRFLGIEHAAGSSNFAPFVTALDDPLPWMRDLAAGRLVQSEACNASRLCQEAFLNAARKLLQSKRLGERWEALQWLGALSLAIPDGQPRMPDPAVRQLWLSAVDDPNLWIADEAFRQLALFDFFHSARAGECIGVFPSIRKSIRFTAADVEGVAITGTSTCMPVIATPSTSAAVKRVDWWTDKIPMHSPPARYGRNRTAQAGEKLRPLSTGRFRGAAQATIDAQQGPASSGLTVWYRKRKRSRPLSQLPQPPSRLL